MILTQPELVRWGERVGREVEPPVLIALRGPLGAGKSVLARAIAHGAGVDGPIPSPTFNLLFRYEGERADVVHLDLYRISGPADLRELGWDDLGATGEIVLVEWPERAGPALPPDRWEIELRVPDSPPDVRKILVRRVGRPPEISGFPMALSPERGHAR